MPKTKLGSALNAVSSLIVVFDQHPCQVKCMHTSYDIPFYDHACPIKIINTSHGTQGTCSVEASFASVLGQSRFPSLVKGQQARYIGAVQGEVQLEFDTSYFFFFFFILRRMGKNKALAHHTSTYFHTCRVSI